MNAISHNFVVASTYPLSDLIACRSRILDLMHRVSDGVGNLLMPALDEIELEIAANRPDKHFRCALGAEEDHTC